MHSRTFYSVGILLVAFAPLARGDAYSPPAGYYSATVGLTGSALDAALNARTRGQTVRTYDQARTDLAVTDRDWAFPPPVGNPTAITNILLIYSVSWSGHSRSGVWDSGSTWNREHTWPDSRGIGQPDQGPDFSDLHQLRAANPSANSSRSNNYFDLGGTLAPVTQAPLARRTTATWEPPDVDKGWVARSGCYMATRYDGTETDTTNLVLVEVPPASTSGNPPQMGRKSTLLLWNRLYPPGEWERRRNQIIFDTYQQNRNPFIDYPEFADAIYEAPLGRETRLTWRYRYFTLAELPDDAIAGDLVDPDGDGMANLLEFAFGADPRAADTAVLPQLQAPAAGRARLVYRRQRDRALSGLTYAIETTDNLSGPWGAAANQTEVSVTLSGTVETVTAEFDASGEKIFARLRVAKP